MLIVSMPKTASTNTLHTIADASGITRSAIKGFSDRDPFGFPIIGKLFSDAGTYREYALRYWGDDPRTIYRKHVLPTQGNLRTLEKVELPIVILLRDPDDIRQSLVRMFKDESLGTNPLLLAELTRYKKAYEDKSLNVNALRVYYPDLALNWEHWIKKMMIHMNIRRVKKIVNNHRRRYTGVGYEQEKQRAANESTVS